MKKGGENIISTEAARDVVYKTLKRIKRCERKKLIQNCVKTQNLSKQELADKKPGAKLNVVTCRFGDALQQLIRADVAAEDADGIISVKESDGNKLNSDTDRDIKLQEIICSLTGSALYAKKDLLKAVEKKYTAAYGKIDAHTLSSDSGRVLSVLAKDGLVNKVKKNSAVYYGVEKDKETDRERNKRLMAALSGERFETETVNMLVKYFEYCGYREVAGEKIGGTKPDEGIDGIIEASDILWGSRIKYIVQVKHRNAEEKYEPLMYIQKFGGVLANEDGVWNGIYVTNAKFHETSEKYKNRYKLKRLIFINGKDWLDMAEKCDYKIQ